MPKAKTEKPTIASFTRLIEKKREGNEYTDEEIRSIVDAILDEEMPEYQQAAWVMTTFFQGMSAQEIANFTEEMMLSGEVIEMMDVSRPKIEKYSTGGVGEDSLGDSVFSFFASCFVSSPSFPFPFLPLGESPSFFGEGSAELFC